MGRKTIAIAFSCIVGLAAAGSARAEDNAVTQFGKNLGAGVTQGLKAGLVPAADKDFMATAASGGMAEVEMARIALDKSDSPEIKKHAQQMINDHTKANEELRRIATAKGVALADAPNVNHQAMVDRVRNAPAAEFDRTYVRVAGVNAHEEMRTLFRTQSNNGVDPEVRAFATRTLPTVESHLRHSEEMQDGLVSDAR